MERLTKPKLQAILAMVLLVAGTAVLVATNVLPQAAPWSQIGANPLLLGVPLLLLIGLVRVRKRPAFTVVVTALLLSTLLFGILTQVATGVAPPDRYYLNDVATSGISPAGEHMNATQGTTEATLTFDTV
ncbi:MAG: hypothetical protein R3291_03475, partial [Thermoplasmata archaeon]|nr:hypothetical protein [Thermoplasmata archaeon]